MGLFPDIIPNLLEAFKRLRLTSSEDPAAPISALEGLGGTNFTEQDTNTVNLTLDEQGNLSANVNYASTTEIEPYEDEEGLKMELSPALRQRLPTATQVGGLGNISSTNPVVPLATVRPLLATFYRRASGLSDIEAGADVTPTAQRPVLGGSGSPYLYQGNYFNLQFDLQLDSVELDCRRYTIRSVGNSITLSTAVVYDPIWEVKKIIAEYNEVIIGGRSSAFFEVPEDSELVLRDHIGGVVNGTVPWVSGGGTVYLEGATSIPQFVLAPTDGTQIIDRRNTGSGQAYTLPAATTTTLGGLIVGDGLSVDTAGKVSVNVGRYVANDTVYATLEAALAANSFGTIHLEKAQTTLIAALTLRAGNTLRGNLNFLTNGASGASGASATSEASIIMLNDSSIVEARISTTRQNNLYAKSSFSGSTPEVEKGANRLIKGGTFSGNLTVERNAFVQLDSVTCFSTRFIAANAGPAGYPATIILLGSTTVQYFNGAPEPGITIIDRRPVTVNTTTDY